jgi:hypothetical protein
METRVPGVALALMLFLVPGTVLAQRPHFAGRPGASRLWLPPAMLAALRSVDTTFTPYRETEYLPDLLRWYPRDPHARPYAVIADFNGDGHQDVVIDGRSSRHTRRIVLLSGDAHYRALLLDDRPEELGGPSKPGGAGRRSE